jgi:uncharacterized protein (DUF305 family)
MSVLTRRRPRERVAAVVALLVGTVTAVGCSGAAPTAADDPVRVVQPGAPGEPSRVLDEPPAHQPAAHTEADVAFVRGMIAHHVQALRMTRLVPTRSGREDLPRFAERMDVSQEAELDLLREWLRARDEEVPALTAAHDHPDGAATEPMPGMLTEEELLELEAAEGERFDRRFLESMIRHHEGALEMVEQLHAAGGGEEPELARFAIHVQADQGIELGRMRELLASLDGP